MVVGTRCQPGADELLLGSGPGRSPTGPGGRRWSCPLPPGPVTCAAARRPSRARISKPAVMSRRLATAGPHRRARPHPRRRRPDRAARQRRARLGARRHRGRGRALRRRAGPPDARAHDRPYIHGKFRTTSRTCRTSCPRSPGLCHAPRPRAGAQQLQRGPRRCCGQRPSAHWCWRPRRRWTATGTSLAGHQLRLRRRSSAMRRSSSRSTAACPAPSAATRSTSASRWAGPRWSGRSSRFPRRSRRRSTGASPPTWPSASPTGPPSRPDRVDPKRPAGGPRGPPRPRRAHRAAVGRADRARRGRRGDRHPQAARRARSSPRSPWGPAALRVPAREPGRRVPAGRRGQRPSGDRQRGPLRVNQRHHRGRPGGAVRIGDGGGPLLVVERRAGRLRPGRHVLAAMGWPSWCCHRRPPTARSPASGQR